MMWCPLSCPSFLPSTQPSRFTLVFFFFTFYSLAYLISLWVHNTPHSLPWIPESLPRHYCPPTSRIRSCPHGVSSCHFSSPLCNCLLLGQLPWEFILRGQGFIFTSREFLCLTWCLGPIRGVTHSCGQNERIQPGILMSLIFTS